MESVPAIFPVDDINLEGEWLLPETAPPFPAVVVCHPYPPQGGSMGNHVVLAICLALVERSIAAFRFNFRGVGNSEGSFSGGIGETADAQAALELVYTSAGVDKNKVGLAGYSFGGVIALTAARDDARINRLAVVSSPLSDAGWRQMRTYGERGLFLMGDRDQMVPLEKFEEQKAAARNPEQYRLIKGADHFMGDYEEEAGRIVGDFFAEGFAIK